MYRYISIYVCVCAYIIRVRGHDCRLRRPLAGQEGRVWTHPVVELRADLKSISNRCHLSEVTFVWELTTEIIHLTLGCLQVGTDEFLLHECGWMTSVLARGGPVPIRSSHRAVSVSIGHPRYEIMNNGSNSGHFRCDSDVARTWSFSPDKKAPRHLANSIQISQSQPDSDLGLGHFLAKVANPFKLFLPRSTAVLLSAFACNVYAFSQMSRIGWRCEPFGKWPAEVCCHFSLIRNSAPLGPYGRTMPRALWWPWGGYTWAGGASGSYMKTE